MYYHSRENWERADLIPFPSPFTPIYLYKYIPYVSFLSDTVPKCSIIQFFFLPEVSHTHINIILLKIVEWENSSLLKYSEVSTGPFYVWWLRISKCDECGNKTDATRMQMVETKGFPHSKTHTSTFMYTQFWNCEGKKTRIK